MTITKSGLEREVALARSLAGLARQAAISSDYQALLESSLEPVSLFGAVRSALLAIVGAESALVSHASVGSVRDNSRVPGSPPNLENAEWCLRTRQPLCLRIALADSILPKDRAASADGFERLLAPLLLEGETIGVLQVDGDPGEAFAEGALEILEAVSTHVAVAIGAIRRAQANDEFLSLAAHELKTPITSIRGYAQILQRYCQQNRDAQAPNWDRLIDSLGIINLQTDRLRQIIDELLDVSRIEMGRLALELAEFDLVATLLESIAQLQGSLGRRIQFRQLGGRRPIAICADELRMQQVISTLVNNAAQHSDLESPIMISCRSFSAPGSAASIAVTVKDQGSGIVPEDLPFVFDRFRQSSVPVKRRREGLGVGLFVAASLVRLHGGEIQCVSAPGKGSAFTFRLPLAP